MNLLRAAPLACLVLLGACDAVPRDIDGTLARVGSARTIRVGMIENAAADADRRLSAAYLARLQRATGAVPRIATGPAEPLLARLEAGELDLVLGEVALDSPWVGEVAIIEPLAEHRMAGRVIGFSPIARNGENRWIMLLERTARDMREER